MNDRRGSFEALVWPIAPALLRTARRLAGPAEAEDLVQETFLRAYRTFDGFTPGTSGKAWLFTILYSIVTNRWRQQSRRPVVESIDDVDRRFSDAIAGDLPGPELLYSQAETRAVVDRALTTLPDEFRAAVILVDVEGLTYDEAAAVMTCPVGTVRSRLARARRQLFITLSADRARAEKTTGSRA